MSNLIEVNPQNSSIKSITLGRIRFTAFEASSDYKVQVTSFTDGFYFTQETYVCPCQFEHGVSRDPNGKLWAVLRYDEFEILFHFDCKDTYIAVCELFSMPINEDVIRAFEGEV